MTNPYQSPASTDESVRERSASELLALREHVRLRLRWPVTGLVICSIIGAVWAGGVAIVLVFLVVAGSLSAEELLPNAGGNALLAAYNTLIGIALSKLGRMQSYRSAVVLAGISVAPCLSPGFVLGIPFGIWLLVVLIQSPTRDAFQPSGDVVSLRG